MTMNLTDKQKEEIKSLIDRNEFLPKKYKGILFPNVPAKRKERSETELSNALEEHVAYEHNMLKFTKEALVKCFSGPKSTCNAWAVNTCSTPPMNRKDPKQEDLWSALDACLDNSSTHKGNTNRGNLWNALVESSLIHFRNLYDFYKKEGVRSDDMVAGDFLSEWNISPANECWKSRKEDVNKRLAHLTWKRVEKPEPKWPFEEYEQMEKEIENESTRFLEKLPAFLTSPKDGGVS